MDLLTALAQIPGIGPFLPYLLLAATVSSALATVLPPPPPGTFYAQVYGLVNWLALNVGKAKNASAPDAPKPPTGTAASIGALLILCLLAGCTASSPAQSIYATAALYDQAEVAAIAYAKSPDADPAVVAELKRLDNEAYLAIKPPIAAAAAGGSPVTAVESEAAPAALSAFTNYLATHKE